MKRNAEGPQNTAGFSVSGRTLAIMNHFAESSDVSPFLR